MPNDHFTFKRFTVRQDKCAMKVGTDGVLLGAWAGGRDILVSNVLDVGTGTGVVALMLAQRFPGARIDAIDIDVCAVSQATENFAQSEWIERICAVHSSVQDFRPDRKYDLIVSNPPYFIDSMKADAKRTLARHTDTLSYADLVDGVVRLLGNDGSFAVIFPYVESNIFIIEAAKKGLYVNRRMDVAGAPGKPVKRVLLEFSFNRVVDVPVENLIIESGGRHCYTEKYRELTKDFYLKF